jgi:hypothetical protein
MGAHHYHRVERAGHRPLWWGRAPVPDRPLMWWAVAVGTGLATGARAVGRLWVLPLLHWLRRALVTSALALLSMLGSVAVIAVIVLLINWYLTLMH